MGLPTGYCIWTELRTEIKINNKIVNVTEHLFPYSSLVKDIKRILNLLNVNKVLFKLIYKFVLN